MSNILAGAGREHPELLNENIKAKRGVFGRYVEVLGGIEGVHFMPDLEGAYSNR